MIIVIFERHDDSAKKQKKTMNTFQTRQWVACNIQHLDRRSSTTRRIMNH